MNQWLANNQDAIALAIIVLMILAGDAGTFEAVNVIGLPDIVAPARSLVGRVRSIVGHRQVAPIRAIQSVAHENACLAPPGPV